MTPREVTVAKPLQHSLQLLANMENRNKNDLNPSFIHTPGLRPSRAVLWLNDGLVNVGRRDTLLAYLGGGGGGGGVSGG